MASQHSETVTQPGLRGLSKFNYLHAIEPAHTTRVEGLSDAIFAVAMTLLILDVKLAPMSDDASARQYFGAVIALWPKLIIFLCSFITLGRLWQIHRVIFHLLKRCDQRTLFWNLLVLISVCLLPFSTALAGEHPYFSLSAAIYASNLLLVNLVYRGLWRHALHGDRLVQGDLDPAIRKAITQTFNVYTFLIFVALVLAYFNSLWSIGLIVLHQLVMFFAVPFFKGREA